jgi:hypothetical protein
MGISPLKLDQKRSYKTRRRLQKKLDKSLKNGNLSRERMENFSSLSLLMSPGG